MKKFITRVYYLKKINKYKKKIQDLEEELESTKVQRDGAITDFKAVDGELRRLKRFLSDGLSDFFANADQHFIAMQKAENFFGSYVQAFKKLKDDLFLEGHLKDLRKEK